jgi:hypothetical protein
MRRLGGSAARRFGVAGAVLLAASASRLEAQAATLEAVLVELQIGRLASRTVDAFRTGDEALVPLSVFFEMAEYRVVRQPDSAMQAVVQPGNVPLLIEPASRTVKLGKDKLPVRPDQLIAAGGEVFLSTSILARALALEWQVSWPDLQVTVIEPGTLPLARRLRRESMLRARLAGASEARHTGLRLGLERPRLDGLVFDYSVLTPTTGIDGAAYATTLGLDVLGGSLALGLQSQNGAGRAPRSEASWSGIWRDNAWLSQARLGDGVATGPRARTQRGISLSNSPYVRSASLGAVPFGGQLGAGWTVEAYRGGRLIGFDSVNSLGQFSFDVPVQYGENPVDFVAYGPFGEVREFNRTYRVASEGLPAGHFEYGASAGECRTERCRATGNLDLRYGISNRWTVRAGLDQFWRDSLTNLSHPYVAAIGSLTNAVVLEGEAVGAAVLRGAVRVEPSVNLQLTAEAHRFSRDVQGPILTPEGRRNQWTLTAFFRPISRLSGTYLDGSYDRITTATGVISSGRFGGSLQLSDIRLLPAVRFQHQTGAGAGQSQTFLGLNTFILPRPSLGKILGSLTARTTLEVERGAGAASASAFLGFPIARGLRSETGVSWYRGMKGPAFSLLIAAELPTVRSYTTASAGGGGEAMGTQYLSGSAIYSPAWGSVSFSGMPALERGGLAGRVFLDANGNGRLDAGEQTLSDVRVIVGPVFTSTDSSGTYRVWDILPYEPTAVRVDSASLASPLWVPAYGAMMFEPSPNRYRRLDIPVLPGGVVEGRVIASQGEPTAGLVLVMKHSRSGEQRLVTTFTDGTFYLIGVRPGAWELSLDEKSLDAIRVSAAPLHFNVPSSPEGATIDGLELRLAPAGRQ